MATTNRDVVGEKCVINGRGHLATSDHGKLWLEKSTTRNC